MGADTYEYILAVLGAYFLLFHLTCWFRALNLGPRPIPNDYAWATTQVCPILGFWRKPGIEIQLK